MSFWHLRRRLGTKLAAFALIAVSGCMEYSTTAYSGYYESSGIGPTLPTRILAPQSLGVGIALVHGSAAGCVSWPGLRISGPGRRPACRASPFG